MSSKLPEVGRGGFGRNAEDHGPTPAHDPGFHPEALARVEQGFRSADEHGPIAVLRKSRMLYGVGNQARPECSRSRCSVGNNVGGEEE